MSWSRIPVSDTIFANFRTDRGAARFRVLPDGQVRLNRAMVAKAACSVRSWVIDAADNRDSTKRSFGLPCYARIRKLAGVGSFPAGQHFHFLQSRGNCGGVTGT